MCILFIDNLYQFNHWIKVHKGHAAFGIYLSLRVDDSYVAQNFDIFNFQLEYFF